MRGESVDVIIIGGGLCGSAIAYYCAQHGIRTSLFERVTIGGGGATMHSRGIIRGYDPNPQLMVFALEGIRLWREWDIAGPTPFRQCGVLYLVAADNAERALEAISNRENPDEYPITVLDCDTLSKRFPRLCLNADLAPGRVALFEPLGGYCDPRLAARLYAETATRLGATVFEGANVTAIQCGDNSVTVWIESSRLEGKLAVLAAGAYSTELLPSLPIVSRSIPITCFHEPSGRFDDCVILDEETGVYLRPGPPTHFYCGGALQVQSQSPSGLSLSNGHVCLEHMEKLSRLAQRGAGEPIYSFIGFDGYTQDFLPLIGFHGENPRVCLATGFSGRGAKYIPATAKRVSELINARLADMA
jgi:glycine/D-amino acid oxidase-like deaminating enzyme